MNVKANISKSYKTTFNGPTNIPETMQEYNTLTFCGAMMWLKYTHTHTTND